MLDPQLIGERLFGHLKDALEGGFGFVYLCFQHSDYLLDVLEEFVWAILHSSFCNKRVKTWK